MNDRLKRQAHQLGFDLCGIAAAGPAQTHTRYTDWLAHGYHAQMSYLARPDAITRRADARQLLPGAKSVVVVAMNYWPGQASAGPGLVARYAWRPDYHYVIADKLGQLAAWVEAEVGQPVAHKVCVDTSAILEREWAARAGLGWIGKNAMLINPRFGSWLLLGELLLDLDLNPNLSPNPIPDHCGTCTRCIQACPSGCILPHRALDANRCISYLTIESRANIPAELNASIGQWVFGCDICQQVCPWNRFARPAALPQINPAWASIDPAEVMVMNKETFRARFAGSAITRAKLWGLQRNAAIVAENLKHQ